MKAALLIDYYLNNKIFDIDDKSTNRDNCNYSFFLLRTKLLKYFIDLQTYDKNHLNDVEIVLCFDLPKVKFIPRDGVIAYLFLFESCVIRPDSWEFSKHDLYKKIFTWNDRLVDNKKYFKINFSHLFPDKKEYLRNTFTFEERSLCTLISGNKSVDHPFELYSKRVEAIRWFEKNALEDFDLYGVGWNQYCGGNNCLRKLSKAVPILNWVLSDKYPSYKGQVVSKFETLKKYCFAICFENAQQIPGYITEKIFDCFFSGCIPIYWGAPNITEHIPPDCFIDMREFESYDELHCFIKNMSSCRFKEIQNNIKEFLFSDASIPFRSETFVDSVASQIMSELNHGI